MWEERRVEEVVCQAEEEIMSSQGAGCDAECEALELDESDVWRGGGIDGSLEKLGDVGGAEQLRWGDCLTWNSAATSVLWGFWRCIDREMEGTA